MKNVFYCIGLLFSVFSFCSLKAQDVKMPHWQSVKKIAHSARAYERFNVMTTNDGNMYFMTSAFMSPYIYKYNSEGELLWRKDHNIEDVIYVELIKSSDDNFLGLTTASLETIKVGDTVIDNPSKLRHVIVSKIDSSLNIIWAKAFLGGALWNSFNSDSQGNFYVAGVLDYSINIEGTELKRYYSLGLPHRHQDFIAKFNSSGNLLWLKSNINSNYDRFSSSLTLDNIKVSPDNKSLILSGLFEGDTLIVGTDTILFKTYGKKYRFIAYCDSSGKINNVFLDKTGDIEHDESQLLYDSDNNILYKRNNGDYGLVTKYSENGTTLAHTKLGKINAHIHDIALDDNNNAYLSLYFKEHELELQKEPKVSIINSNKVRIDFDVCIVMLDSSFQLKWYKHIINPQSDFTNAIVVNKPANGLYFFGAGETSNKGDSISFGDFSLKSVKRSEYITYAARIGLCNTPLAPLTIKNGVLQAPSNWKNWTWYVDNEEIEDRNWYTYTPQKSGTYVVVTKEKNGCYSYTEPFVWYATSINDINVVKESIKLYPNPARQTFTLETPKLIDNIGIYNASGQLIKNIPINQQGEYKIDIQNSGLYFIKVSSPNGYLMEKVVIW